MEKITFILLLSLSLCLGTPQQDVGTPKTTTAPVIDNKASGQTTVPVTPAPAPPATVKNDTAAATTANPTSTQSSAADTNNGNKAKETSNETKTSTSTEAVTEKASTPLSKDNSTTTASPSKASNDTTPNAGNVTTPKNETSTTKPTELPPSHADEKATVQARAFDGPSFIGGIILTLGILAIGFMGFKYYRNQTERNYHTL